MQRNFKFWAACLMGGVLLAGCRADGNNPGVEYAPQMYHAVGYEPLTLIDEEGIPGGIISSRYYDTNTMPYNDYKGKQPINMLKPVPGTVKRQNFVAVTSKNQAEANQPLLNYDLHKDSIDLASRILKNPVPESAEVLAEGKHLYLAFCGACHGEDGAGQGKVGIEYKGVPNYSAGRYATMTEGHIFHTITHGRGRMWPHKSQLNPEERWKVVRYVQTLQKGS